MRELHSGTPPARAFKDAQVWLSNSTGTQLAEVLRSLRLPQEAMRRSCSRSFESATAIAGPMQSFGRGGHSCILGSNVLGLEAERTGRWAGCLRRPGDRRLRQRYALIVANNFLESEISELKEAVSQAYTRGRFRTYME